ncbi:pyridoxamine 5'-phosphate oxidase family protein [Nocardia sp. NPDC056100]|uniref:pyridoxamine 5'-phosphate oxidase family protein n=1 Tax=Nocardia sp. NPDC056100 TaxID=3345712 RepID=UPI0035DA8664
MSSAKALLLLTEIRFGRVVFTRSARPMIRPVTHVIDGTMVVIRADPSTSVAVDHHMVAYQADTIDHHTHTGWCVIITGVAEKVTDPEERARYQRLLRTDLPDPRTQILRIHPEIITGIEYLRSRR